jgi:hypothetical protein
MAMTQHPSSTCSLSQHFSFICEGNGVFNLCRFVSEVEGELLGLIEEEDLLSAL